MKNAIVLACSLLTLSVVGQEENTWRFGLQLGVLANDAQVSGGMDQANGRFEQEPYGAGNLNFTARYDFNRHWAIESGIGINSFGFNYNISGDYSLRKRDDNLGSINTGFIALELPVDVFYKFSLNCRNIRWVLGAGLAPTFIASDPTERDDNKTEEGVSANDLRSNSVTQKNAVALLRYTLGREKVFRNGSVFRMSLLVNIGFTNLASSTVNYTLDNQDYTHSFVNKGNSVGLRLSYFLPTKK